MAMRFFSIVFSFVVALGAGACTSQYQVRDAETGAMKASRYERWTPLSYERTVACSKQKVLAGVGAQGEGKYVQLDCSTYGTAYVPTTLTEQYGSAGGYNLPSAFPFQLYSASPITQAPQAPNPYVAVVMPSEAVKASGMRPGWYQFGSWVFDECGNPQYSPQTRVVRTYSGNQVIEPDRPRCWVMDLRMRKIWTGDCGWTPPPLTQCLNGQ